MIIIITVVVIIIIIIAVVFITVVIIIIIIIIIIKVFLSGESGGTKTSGACAYKCLLLQYLASYSIFPRIFAHIFLNNSAHLSSHIFFLLRYIVHTSAYCCNTQHILTHIFSSSYLPKYFLRHFAV